VQERVHGWPNNLALASHWPYNLLMEHDQLIARAKSHLAGTVARETTPPNPDDFPRISVREAAIVHFETPDRKTEAWVLLDRTNGAFLAGWSRGLEGAQGSMAG